MRRSVWAILAGLVLSVLGAAAVAKIFELPLAGHQAGEVPIFHLLRTALPIAAFALPGALTAILLAEARRVRGLLFWLFAGVVLAALAYLTLPKVATVTLASAQSPRTMMTLLGMGTLAGFLYWWIAGRKSGAFAAAIARASHDHRLDENGLRTRCRVCTATTLLLGLLPLALIGWHLAYKPGSLVPAALTAEAESVGTQQLVESGLATAKLSIENHVGRISGMAADDAGRTVDFNKAKTVLEPMVGLPGVVAYLQNDIHVTEAPPVTKPEPTDAANSSKLKAAKPADDKHAQSKAQRKAEEAAAKARAVEEERAIAEVKHKAGLILAAQAKNAEEALNAAKAKQRAEDEKRLADDLAAQRKADEEKRLALEAQTERNAVEAAHKAVAEKAAEAAANAKVSAATVPSTAPAAVPAPAQVEAVPVSAPMAAATPLPVPDTNCAADFSDAFRVASVRFGLRSAELDKMATDSLERIAAVAKRCGGYNVAIGGHADRTGNAAVNAKMSESRALAVREALEKRGIEAKRLIAEGYGNQRPFDPANSRAAYRLNRRVDFGAALTPAPKPTVKSAAAGPATLPMAATIAGWPVAQCESEFSRLFLSDTIRFIGASAIVSDNHADYLDGLARIALSCPTHKVAINGHTDRRGSAIYNQALSEERANAVRDALVDRDVPDARLAATGYGGQHPFDPARTRAAYALNRRVDFAASVQAPKVP